MKIIQILYLLLCHCVVFEPINILDDFEAKQIAKTVRESLYFKKLMTKNFLKVLFGMSTLKNISHVFEKEFLLIKLTMKTQEVLKNLFKIRNTYETLLSSYIKGKPTYTESEYHILVLCSYFYVKNLTNISVNLCEGVIINNFINRVVFLSKYWSDIKKCYSDNLVEFYKNELEGCYDFIKRNRSVRERGGSCRSFKPHNLYSNDDTSSPSLKIRSNFELQSSSDDDKLSSTLKEKFKKRIRKNKRSKSWGGYRLQDIRCYNDIANGRLLSNIKTGAYSKYPQDRNKEASRNIPFRVNSFTTKDYTKKSVTDDCEFNKNLQMNSQAKQISTKKPLLENKLQPIPGSSLYSPSSNDDASYAYPYTENTISDSFSPIYENLSIEENCFGSNCSSLYAYISPPRKNPYVKKSSNSKPHCSHDSDLTFPADDSNLEALKPAKSVSKRNKPDKKSSNKEPSNPDNSFLDDLIRYEFLYLEFYLQYYVLICSETFPRNLLKSYFDIHEYNNFFLKKNECHYLLSKDNINYSKYSDTFAYYIYVKNRYILSKKIKLNNVCCSPEIFKTRCIYDIGNLEFNLENTTELIHVIQCLQFIAESYSKNIHIKIKKIEKYNYYNLKIISIDNMPKAEYFIHDFKIKKDETEKITKEFLMRDPDEQEFKFRDAIDHTIKYTFTPSKNTEPWFNVVDCLMLGCGHCLGGDILVDYLSNKAAKCYICHQNTYPVSYFESRIYRSIN